jgi:LacI family transcriptional regulator
MSASEVQPPRPAVTRKEVARYAGVSSAVVSYVVNAGPKNVAPATAARVQEAIRVLGYRPNAAARALKLGSTETLGLIVPRSDNPFFAQFAHAVEEAAGKFGYVLLLANSDGSLTKERRHLRTFLSRQIGAVLLASVVSEPDLSDLTSADVPVVLLNQGKPADGFAAVGVDLRQGAREAVQHLIGHGHKTIGLVVGTYASNETDDRELGWLDALTGHGFREGPIARGDFSPAGGYAAGKRLLAAAERPTGIFVSSDGQAVGVLRALHEGGIRVPEDIAVVSFDGSPESEYSWPALTTVRQPLDLMASAAVGVAITGGSVPHHQIFPTELLIRQSCGCRPLDHVAED